MLGTSTIFSLPAPPPDGNIGALPLSQMEDHEHKQPPPQPQHNNSQFPDPTNSNSNSKSSPPPPPSSIPTHTRTIGIIHPPTDIRNIVDKTAQFVAKNGPEFEKRIVHNNAGNAKFNFLTSPDPYHAYYQHRLSEFRAQNQSSTPHQSSDSPLPDSLPPALDPPDPPPKQDLSLLKPIRKVLEPPEAEQYTVRLPEGVTGEELDIVKLTAQFVARNGKSFLTGLTSREINNPQFHFLKPTHSMFMFFTTLADAYSKVLMPPKGIVDKLRRSVADMTTVLERCLHRLEWEHSQERARQKAEDEIEQERVQMAMIDWHDFVVVEAIDFVDDEDEDLPNPMTVEEVVRRSKMPSSVEDEEMNEPGKEVEMEMDEEEVQFVEEGMRAARIEDNPEANDDNNVVVNSADSDAPMRIVKNWKRPEERLAAERDVTKFVISPITGEFVTISEMSEHMRISLIDPKYKEQKERMFAKIRETTLAHDDEISRNIVGLARTRPDIFGTTEEEVSNAVKAEIEKKDEQPSQVIWDGHSGSIGRTANQALSNNVFAGEDQGDGGEGRMILGPSAPPPPRPGFIPIRPMPIPPPGMALNVPRVVPLNPGQFPPPPLGGQQLMNPPRPPMVAMGALIRAPPPPPPMAMTSAQQSGTVSRPPPLPPSVPGSSPSMGMPPPPPPPGSQFTTHLTIPRSFVPLPVPPPPAIHMIPPPPLPQGVPPPPPPEEAPPLPDGPEPKRPKLDDSFLIPEDQFLAKHLGPVCICISVPNTEEGNMKGQVLDIIVQSLSETVGSLKEKIAGETQLPANKQKLSGRAGFLKDNMSLAHYNVGPRETLSLSLRERGGRKR